MLGAPTGRVRLTAEFDDARDIGPGHTVQVANVVVGSVTKVRLHGYRARLTMSITDGHPIPVGTVAAIRQTSLLGEPFVELTFPPRVDPTTSRHLADGDAITATRTDPSIEEIARRTGELVAAVQPDDLASSVQASAEALTGNGPELHRLIAQLSSLIGAVDAQRDDLAGTIDNLASLGATFAPLDGRIGSLLDSTAAITGELGGDTDELVTALGTFDHVARATNEVILIPHADELAALLRQASTVVGSLAHNQQVLAHMADSLAAFIPRITNSITKGQLLVFTWVDLVATDTGLPLGTRVPAYLSKLVDPRTAGSGSTPRPS
jgi:phospholipid/cholesterol/gamma-HCH transport system substrate-binding protein